MIAFQDIMIRVVIVKNVHKIVWNAKIYTCAQNAIPTWVDTWNSKNVNVKMDFMITNNNVSHVILDANIVLIILLVHLVIQINCGSWLMGNVYANQDQ